MNELIKKDPGVDLTALTTKQIDRVMELFVGNDLCRRIGLDVGKAMFDKADDAVTAIKRLRQMNNYAKQCVAAAFHKRRMDSKPLTKKSATELSSKIIKDTFDVFEEYYL